MLVRADARQLPIKDETVQCVVTSPPYFGLRDYGGRGQIGLEETPDAYVDVLVDVFREAWRVLRPDGVLWLNIGDSYARNGGSGAPGASARVGTTKSGAQRRMLKTPPSLKAKDLIGIPWMVALALRADGWWLRADVIWEKPNCMPESVTDRPTRSHEYVFLLTKAERYFWNELESKEPSAEPSRRRADRVGGATGHLVRHSPGGIMTGGETRNCRTVWQIDTQPYADAHFATMPEMLAHRCIAAGSRAGDLILDLFGGTGTVGRVAVSMGRRAVVTELNPEYLDLARQRVRVTRGLPL